MSLRTHNRFRGAVPVAGWFLALAALPLQAAETAEALFRQAVQASGKTYVEIRTEFVARADETTPVLDEALNSAKDWQTRLTAEALRFWVRDPKASQELWDWKAPESAARNPFPHRAAAARLKFSTAGKETVPLILELIWKKSETQFGALPTLLAEWDVESAIPVLVEWMVAAEYGPGLGHIPESLGRFGERATPCLLAALPAAGPAARSGLVQALGLTGDLQAVDELRQRLKEDANESVREWAAKALEALRQYAALREDLPGLEVRTQISVLRVLGNDKSE